MKLHIKLMLSLLMAIVAVAACAQLIQYLSVNAHIARFSQENLLLLQKREELFAKNIFKSIEHAVAGSLERGEMEKFNRILAEQRDIDGLMEFSLHNRQAMVTHSSNATYLSTKLPEEIQTQMAAEPKMVLRWTAEAFEIVQPQMVTGDCVRCHLSWKPGEVGGYTHFRFSKAALTKARQGAAEIQTVMRRSLLRNALFSLAGIVAVLVLVLYIVVRKFVALPLKRMNERVQDIAEGQGDLTARIAVDSQDEIGMLSSAFNRFIEKLQHMIRDIAANAEALGTSAVHLAGLATNISSDSASMQTRSNAVAVSAGQMSHGMQSVSDVMGQATQNISTVAAAAEQMNAVITEIVQNVAEAHGISDGAVAEAQASVSMMSELDKSAKDIAKATESITEISAQTNLLALNATIEAARAGEAGRGFAVVAKEIKELANQTAASSIEIKEKNRGIQTAVETAIQKIQEIGRIITKVNDFVSGIAGAMEEQTTTTRDIAANVVQVSDGIHDVNRTVAQSSAASAQIAGELSEVNASVDGMTRSNAQVHQNAEELSRLADQLKGLVGRFTV